LEFGVLKSDSSEFQERRKLLEKAIFYFDSIIAHTVLDVEKDRAKAESEALLEAELNAGDSDLLAIRHKIYEGYSERFNKLIEPKIYLFLGHFQLLLQKFDDALSAYLKYESLCPSAASQDCAFLYGLGLCTFRFNAFHRTLKTFQQILYLQPWFPKAKEIHIRLGYIYKIQRNFEKSLKHFRQALNDSTPATFSRIEIRFHIAHLFEVCGKPKQAVTEYRQLLDVEKANAPTHIRHLCLRQLAWLHHTGACGPKSELASEKDLNVQWLQSALELDSTNGKTWYLLGRCQAALNRVQEAFAAYRSSIDKTEASADTWCSIGVLYQEQSQPMDALQAYFCAVQLDKCHVAAWANLGTLYESMQQYKEALKCYKNAVNADKNNEIKPELRSRLLILQQILPRLPEKLLSGGTHSGNTPGVPSVANAAAAISGGGAGPGCTTITKLPTVDEAWSLPIPAELTQRQMQLMLQEAAASGEESGTGGLYDDKNLASLLLAAPVASVLSKKRSERHHSSTSNDSRKSGSEASGEGNSKRPRRDSSPNVMPLNTQQAQMLHTLQMQETALNASQRHLLVKLQDQALRYHQHRLSQRSTPGSTEAHDTGYAKEDSSIKVPPVSTRADTVNTGSDENVNPSSISGADPVDLFPSEDDLPAVVGSPGAEHLPEEDLAFLTDDLLAQLNRAEAAANLDLVELALFANATAASEQQRPSSSGGQTSDDRASRSRLGSVSATGELQRDAVKSENPRSTIGHSVPMDCPETITSPVGSGETPGVSRRPNSDPVDLYTYLTRPLHTPESVTASLNINMSALQIINKIRGLGRSGGPWWPSILAEGAPIPAPPSKPYPPPSKDRLLPPTPSVYLESRKDAHSPELMRYCFSQPAVVIRGLAAALRLDLGLFSTKSLVEAHPDHRIEVRTQIPQPPDVNHDSQGRTVWFCESPRTVTTIAKFAAYQARSFIEAVREEKFTLSHHSPNTGGHVTQTPPSVSHGNVVENGGTPLSGGSTNSGPIRKDSDSATPETGPLADQKSGTTSTLGTPHLPLPDTCKPGPGRSTGSSITSTADSGPQTARSGKPKYIRFGTNCDLSDEKKWFPQLHELTKLPTFVRVVSAFNMLSHVGYSLLGMNTVQLYLKVPGCRTPGHQENNCFCSVNINIGPGDCEWFSVPEQYWGAVHDLCEKNNVDYLTGSWWPNLETLYNEEIPVYRFIQRPGDLVWINAGTVHWVQAIGWCNNIAWNVGPLTSRQYHMALERYEFNRLRGVKSIVPMIHFSWQLAKNVKISDPGLYELIKQALLRSIVQSQLATDFIEKLGLPIRRHGKRPDDVAHSCHDCEIEVFNLLYVIAQDKKLVVRCMDCARRIDPSLRTFTILAEYYMHELSEIYDDFQLQTQPLAAYPVGKT
ncbi:hypothetical protein EG68_04794, partial [Paragonimus skrjabini miyazakii]